jgi:hypothetical protein
MHFSGVPVILFIVPLLMGWAVCCAAGAVVAYSVTLFISERLMKLLGIYKLFIRFMFAYYGKKIAPEPAVETADSLRLRKMISDLIDIIQDLDERASTPATLSDEQWAAVDAAATEQNFFNTRSK